MADSWASLKMSSAGRYSYYDAARKIKRYERNMLGTVVLSGILLVGVVNL